MLFRQYGRLLTWCAFFILLGSSHYESTAQYNNVWAFGYGAGLNFNTIPPTPIKTSIASAEAAAAISDVNGDLLFYTDGSSVWNKNGSLMPNGASLLPLQYYPNGWQPTTSSRQGAVIVPKPEAANLYYIFSITNWELGEIGLAGHLFYSIVDMNLDGGLGDVKADEKGIYMDSMFNEIAFALPGDRCNFWLLAPSNQNQQFKAFEITASGISDSPIISHYPSVPYPNLFPILVGGTVNASSDSRKVAVHFRKVGVIQDTAAVYLGDFNGSSGEISSWLEVPNVDSLNSPPGQSEFSPDGTMLYVPTSNGRVYQLDITSADPILIRNSALLINPNNPYQYNGFLSGAPLRRAPDGKIYFLYSPFPISGLPPFYSTRRYLGVIPNPDAAGITCGFEPLAVELLDSTAFGRFPNWVPVLPRDTFYTIRSQIAPCFANKLSVYPQNNTGWGHVWNIGVESEEAVVDTPGAYWVSYYSAPCNYHVDTIDVRFPNGRLPIINSLAECKGDHNGGAYVTTYLGDPVQYTYTWLKGNDTLIAGDTLLDVSGGSYRLHVSTENGCDTLLFFEIPEEDYKVSFSASDTLICLGDTITFENTSDHHFTSFYWDLGNGDSSLHGDVVDYQYLESGAYRVTLIGEGSICRDTAHRTILVDQPISPSFDLNPKTVCVGEAVSLVPYSDSTTVQFQWQVKDQIRREADIVKAFQHAFDRSGVFPIILDIHSRACPDTSYTDSITVYPLPEVYLGTDSAICLHGAPIYLKNLSEAPLNPHHYLWSTGDTTEILKVVHPGIYTLSVTTEPLGCTTTESIEITKDCYIDIPNVFTPNGDGHNDYFLPRQLLSESVDRFHMQVFNRWGQLIFETDNIDGRGWDGRFNGTEQPIGVYLYRIEVTFTNGRQESYEGNVTLVR